jgi:transcriptional regulator with XRE-family HTH domain
MEDGMSGFITAEQMRAARAMLRWEQEELAERARVSAKTIKRMEATSGKMDSRSDFAVMKAFELAGIEFLDGDDRRRRGEGVRFQADRTAKLREDLVENVTRGLGYNLKRLVDEDQDVFERPTNEIIEFIMVKLQEEFRMELRSTLNKRD